MHLCAGARSGEPDHLQWRISANGEGELDDRAGDGFEVFPISCRVTFRCRRLVALRRISRFCRGNTNVELGDVLGTVTAVGSGTVNITTAFGDSLALTTASGTVYSYPSGTCASASSACVAGGQIVSVDLSLPGDGGLAVNSLSYVGASGSAVVKALVLGVDDSGAEPVAKMLVQRQIGATGLTPGQIAEVTLAPTTTYGVGTVNYPAVAAGSFANAGEVVVGQEVFAGVASGSGTAFGASGLLLESSQVVGEVSAGRHFR